MAPEIVDLVSDDEENEVAVGSSNGSSSKGRAIQNHPSTPRTINPTLISLSQPSRIDSEASSSTVSSRTEPNSPLHPAADPASSPLFMPTTSLNLNAGDTSKGKGKARAAPIPEIDLSLDTDEDNSNPITPTAAMSESGWDYGNGEFTEEDALKQAIALSLQETLRSQRSNGEGDRTVDVGMGASASTSSRKVASLRPAKSGPLPLPMPLPNWHSSPTKPAASSPISENPAIASPSSTPLTVNATASATMPLSSVPPMAVSRPVADAEQKPPTATNTSSFILAGLDRKQMEAERLARLKRKHGETQEAPTEAEAGSGEPNAKVAKVMKGTAVTRNASISPPPIKQKQRAVDTNNGLASGSGSRSANHTKVADTDVSCFSSSSSSALPALYPRGVILKTYLSSFPTAQTISFPQLLAPATHLESALLSSFIWNFDWLFPHFETRSTKFHLVMHAKSAMEQDTLAKDFRGVPNVRLTFPPMEGNVNCMHSKLMLLFYKGDKAAAGAGAEWQKSAGQRCRIVVPTANLVDFDWGAGGFMENTCWVIDLPLRTSTQASDLEETGFQKSLKQFLTAQTVPDDVLRKLDLFDFRETAQYGFVHTIGGMHPGQTWRTTGLCGLGRTVTQLGLATKDAIQMDYVTSSVGSLNDDFMSSMYLAAQGDDGLAEYTKRTNKKPSTTKQLELWRDNFRLYFPSDHTVRSSRGGAHNAGTICFSTKWWLSPKFPRANMVDCVSVRDRILMHNKLLFVKYTSPPRQDEQGRSGKIGWAYVGSANLSESAWGRLVQDKATKAPRLNCRNWECGVVTPIPILASSDSKQRVDANPGNNTAGLAQFAELVPVPMRYPGESMEKKKPWTTFDA